MASMDVFRQDPFSLIAMTQAVNRQKFVPDLLESLGIFTPEPIREEKFWVEKKQNRVALIGTSPRGAPKTQTKKDRATVRDFRTTRLRQGDTLTASEVANIRAFGTEAEVIAVATEVAGRTSKIQADMRLTWENMRLGAITGSVIDADGSSVIYDWYSEFDVTPAEEIAWNFGAATAADGNIKKLANQVKRGMIRSSGNSFGTNARIVALCGDNFFDDLTTNKETRATYLNQPEASLLRMEYAGAYGTFYYGGIEWINYRSTDDQPGDTEGPFVGIPTNECRLFPAGVRNVFAHVMSPAESFDLVNTLGQQWYAKTKLDPGNEFVELDVASYPMFVCKQPEVLRRGRRGA